MRSGTSSIVVAAFIGPGTVLTCASAGMDFSYSLGWVLVFAVATTYILQSYAVSTGILGRRGLGEAIRAELVDRRVRRVVTAFVLLGLWGSCAAYELGNLMGAASGITVLLDLSFDLRWLVVLLAGGAALILLLDLRVLIRVFAGLVILMSLLFVAGLLVAPVDWSAAAEGLLVPRIPEEGLVTVLALVGTTVGTYNLFLHPSAAKEYWADTEDRRSAWRGELRGMALFLPIGGLISFAILAAGATLTGTAGEIEDVGSFALLLEPVAGSFATVCFGLGLFAAGLTSGLTAPLAAAAGVSEIMGWDSDPSSSTYRAIWASVLGFGLVVGLLGWSPLPAIIAAQAVNGLLLPFAAAFVMYLTIRQQVVDLPTWYHLLGGTVTILCGALGIRTLWWVGQQL